MLPLALLGWIAVECAIYLALGRLLFDADWAWSLAGMVGGLLGLRAWLNALTWGAGFAFASPAPRLPAGQAIRMMFDEYLAYLFTFLLVIPFERLWMPPDRLRGGRRVVLLVHGYGCSRGVWWLLRRRLQAAGCDVATLSLFPPFTSLDALVPQLQARIETLCGEHGVHRLTLLGHSMGGLVCRAYLARHGHARIGALLTLASPHAGSALARFGIGENARQMTPGSAWLKALAGLPPEVPAIAFRNLYDNYVMPQDNQRLTGAYDIPLPPLGHIALLYDRRVADLLTDACCSPRSTP